MEPAEIDDQYDYFLPTGTVLQDGGFRILDHIGGGGFGLTYLAEDRIGRKVVLKECFPSNLCHRRMRTVHVHTRTQQEDFTKLIRSFVNEAKQLASLKHPNVVTVHHFFEENGTAYMALEHVEGRDLADMVGETDRPLQPDQVMDLAEQLIDALGYVHSRGILHRDVAPDNILVDKNGMPILIDFGAAKNETATAMTRLLSEQLRAVKDGFSPQELYVAGTEQGPFSDLYALAATLRFVATGEIPTDASTRLMALLTDNKDPLPLLVGRLEGYPERFLAAIDTAMSIFPKDRFQTADEWTNMLLAPMDNASPLVLGQALAVPEPAEKPSASRTGEYPDTQPVGSVEPKSPRSVPDKAERPGPPAAREGAHAGKEAGGQATERRPPQEYEEEVAVAAKFPPVGHPEPAAVAADRDEAGGTPRGEPKSRGRKSALLGAVAACPTYQ